MSESKNGCMEEINELAKEGKKERRDGGRKKKGKEGDRGNLISLLI